MNATQTISEFDAAIRSLENKKTMWASELGMAESGMKAEDIRFLSAQIEILKTARIAALSALADVERNIEKHTEAW